MKLGTARSRSLPVDWQKIRALRGNRSKAEFAEACGVGLSTMHYAESTGAALSQSIIDRIAAALGISADGIRMHTTASTPPRRRERGLPLSELTSFGLGSSLMSAVVDDGD